MHDKLVEAARAVGTEDGKSKSDFIPWRHMRASAAQKVVEGWTSGDEEVMDLCPKPLAGEWVDDPTPMALLDRIANEAGPADDKLLPIPDDPEDLFDVYEEAFTKAFWDSVIPQCKMALEKADDEA